MVKLLFEKQKIQERIKELDESQQKLPNYKLEGVNKKIDEIVARTEERINKQQEYDQKDEQRVSSEVGEGQESIETQPVTETSQEEVSPGGMVQEEQTELEQVRQRINEIDSAASRGEILENSEPGELRELKRREKELSSKLEESIPTEPQNNDSEKTTEEVREVKLNENLPKIEVEGEVVQETTITNEFDELADINKITSPAKKNKAMKAFNEKYGEKAARISQIDSKFTSIVSKLERNKIITKKC
jgi:hypothetical protein